MNLHHFAGIAALLVTSHAIACGDGPLSTTTLQDGSKVGLVISRAQIEAAPAWTPDMGEPPLSISAARDAVLAWAKDRYQRYDGVQIMEISLNQYPCPMSNKRWYYSFNLAPEIEGGLVYSGAHFATVLMDGSVIGSSKL